MRTGILCFGFEVCLRDRAPICIILIFLALRYIKNTVEIEKCAFVYFLDKDNRLSMHVFLDLLFLFNLEIMLSVLLSKLI